MYQRMIILAIIGIWFFTAYPQGKKPDYWYKEPLETESINSTVVNAGGSDAPMNLASYRVYRIGHVPIYGDCRGLSISGSHAFLTDGGGVYSVDISDPAHPWQEDVIGIDTWTYAADIHAVGNYAYVSEAWWFIGRGRLRVLDISNPGNLHEVGRSDKLGDYARDIYVSGNWAYLALDDAGVYILSVNNPGDPGQIIGTYDCPDAIWGIFTTGEFLYAVGDENLWIYDVSSTPVATLTGSWGDVRHGRGIYVSGNYAYVADREFGLHIIDVSDPTHPYRTSSIDTPGEALHIWVENDTAYVADGYQGLRVIDVSDPGAPSELGYNVFAATALDIEVSGGYIYVSAANEQGLYVFKYDETPIIPVAPELHSPLDNEMNVAVNPILSWAEVEFADTYHLQVSEEASFATFAVNNPAIPQNSFAVSGLKQNTNYFWRVNAANWSGNGAWSAVWSFTTMILPAPAAPILASPEDGASEIALNTILSWFAVEYAETYHLQVSRTANFSAPEVDQPALANTEYAISGLEPNTTYFWRINATNASGTGPWSAAWWFSTTTIISIDDRDAVIPSEYSLAQNYPNPFNPLTLINYALPFSTKVELAVYNLLGKKVCPLVHEFKAAGTYQVAWDGRDEQGNPVPSNLYFYRIQAGDFVQTKKMILIR